MKNFESYENSIEFIKDIPLFMFGGSFSLKKRWILDRKIWDIDIIVPASFWWEFKERWYDIYFHTNRYWNIVPDWIFIYTYEFNDWSIDLIFRKDFNSLKFDTINGYKHLEVEEIMKQKEHLLNNWTWDVDSKHKEDIKKIKAFLWKNS